MDKRIYSNVPQAPKQTLTNTVQQMQDNLYMKTQRKRMTVGLGIMAVVALLHILRAGQYLHGEAYKLYYSYASDLLIPFAMYFLLCINDMYISLLRPWYSKAALIIGITALAEILQHFGVYAFGITFDPLDILMYAAGVGAAVVLDRFVFKKIIPSWDWNEQQPGR